MSGVSTGLPLIAVTEGSYVPQPTVQKQALNLDAAKVAEAARVPVQPNTSIHEYNGAVKETADQAARDIVRFISSMERQVKVSKDDVTGYMVVQLINPQTGELIRTLPSDELLRIARSFEILGSVMVNQRA